MMEISPLNLSAGMIARTLITCGDKSYEVMTLKTADAVDAETAEFWSSLIAEMPYETAVYQLVDAKKPYTAIEQKLSEMVPVNEKYRRNLDLGDLYVARSKTEEEAALEHDSVVSNFKTGDILLLTMDERNAIYGPGNNLWK